MILTGLDPSSWWCDCDFLFFFDFGLAFFAAFLFLFLFFFLGKEGRALITTWDFGAEESRWRYACGVCMAGEDVQWCDVMWMQGNGSGWSGQKGENGNGRVRIEG